MILLVIAFFGLILNYEVSNAVTWSQMTPSNSPLPRIGVRDILKDKNDNLWFVTANSALKLKTNGGYEVISGLADNGLIFIHDAIEDLRGNIIFRSNAGVVIYSNSELEYFSSEGEYPILQFNSSIISLDSLILISLATYNKVGAFRFDENINKYVFDESKFLSAVNTTNQVLGQKMVHFDNKLYFITNNFTEQRFSVLDLSNRLYKELDKSFYFGDISNFEFRFIGRLEDEFYVTTRNNDSSSSIYFFDKNLNVRTNTYKADIVNPHLNEFRHCIQVANSEYLIACDRQLLYLKNGIFHLIDKPDILGEDDSLHWVPWRLLIDNNTLYVATFQGGVFRTILTDLLATTSVINYDNIPLVKHTKVYPTPSLDRINCDFFAMNSNLASINFSLYNNFGMEIPNIDFESQFIYGSLYMVSFHVRNLVDGIYYLKIQSDNNSDFVKIIKIGN